MKHIYRICMVLLCSGLLLLTGCGSEAESAPASDKVNVYTSQKFVPKDFLIQLIEEEHVTLVKDLIGNIEEAGEPLPPNSPDFILQYVPESGIKDSVYWWLWTYPDGKVILVNKTEDSTKTYSSTKVVSHEWGQMIEKLTEGMGPVCC